MPPVARAAGRGEHVLLGSRVDEQARKGRSLCLCVFSDCLPRRRDRYEQRWEARSAQPSNMNTGTSLNARSLVLALLLPLLRLLPARAFAFAPRVSSFTPTGKKIQ